MLVVPWVNMEKGLFVNMQHSTGTKELRPESRFYLQTENSFVLLTELL